ncbi:MAG: TauD/TfdA dioxygenase family protein [Rhodospirillales bacterium]|jgi:taurine dioxygenase
MEITKASLDIGAIVTGVDVRKLDDATWDKMYQAFLDHLVLVVRGQKGLSMEEYLNYSARFGPLKPHIVRRQRHPTHPNLMVMDNGIGKPGEITVNVSKEVLRTRGVGWHTDLSYEFPSAKATQLYALALPSAGGDTLFTSCYASYDALPHKLKHRIANLKASYRYGGANSDVIELLDESDRNREATIHPIVRIHPETGRKSLYFDDHKLVKILDVDAAEHDDLAAELRSRMAVPGLELRHKWQMGDIVIWDNRCALHSATGDYPPNERRAFWRITIMDFGWQSDRLSA